MAQFEVPAGWTVQAFRFTLDPTEDQAHALARHFGARRKAFNWTVAALKSDIAAWHATGAQTAKPSLQVLWKRWNTGKDSVCVNAETGAVWWPECSKEAYAEQVPNPRPLDAALKELRHASRARSRCAKGSRRYRERTTEISRLHRRVNDVRTQHLHVLTTRLAKTHGQIVVEGLDAAGMLRQKGLPGARARRRGLSDAALGTPRRHLSYKTGWYGSQLVVADRWFGSSKTCHACGHVQDIGWDEKWQCDGCSVIHQRDDHAAVNLMSVSVVGPVRAAVKRGANRKTEPRSAGGREARKGRSRKAAEQPRDGVQVA
jgi:transposase